MRIIQLQVRNEKNMRSFFWFLLSVDRLLHLLELTNSLDLLHIRSAKTITTPFEIQSCDCKYDANSGGLVRKQQSLAFHVFFCFFLEMLVGFTFVSVYVGGFRSRLIR